MSQAYLMREAIGRPQSVEAIGGPQGRQRPSEAIRGHQRPSEAIRGHQRPAEASRGQQRPTVPAVLAACLPIIQLLIDAREGR